MLRDVNDHQRGASAQTAGGSDDDRPCCRGSAFWPDPSPPVLAFGSQNMTALLVELRRRERLTVRRCSARLVPAPWPSTTKSTTFPPTRRLDCVSPPTARSSHDPH